MSNDLTPRPRSSVREQPASRRGVDSINANPGAPIQRTPFHPPTGMPFPICDICNRQVRSFNFSHQADGTTVFRAYCHGDMDMVRLENLPTDGAYLERGRAFVRKTCGATPDSPPSPISTHRTPTNQDEEIMDNDLCVVHVPTLKQRIARKLFPHAEPPDMPNIPDMPGWAKSIVYIGLDRKDRLRCLFSGRIQATIQHRMDAKVDRMVSTSTVYVMAPWEPFR